MIDRHSGKKLDRPVAATLPATQLQGMNIQ
jgi:hypothetical protein